MPRPVRRIRSCSALPGAIEIDTCPQARAGVADSAPRPIPAARTVEARTVRMRLVMVCCSLALRCDGVAVIEGQTGPVRLNRAGRGRLDAIQALTGGGDNELTAG